MAKNKLALEDIIKKNKDLEYINIYNYILEEISKGKMSLAESER